MIVDLQNPLSKQCIQAPLEIHTFASSARDEWFTAPKPAQGVSLVVGQSRPNQLVLDGQARYIQNQVLEGHCVQAVELDIAAQRPGFQTLDL